MAMTLVKTTLSTAMQTIKASEFKAKCLALIDQVARTGRPLLVTKNRKPVAELRPHRPASGSALGRKSVV